MEQVLKGGEKVSGETGAVGIGGGLGMARLADDAVDDVEGGQFKLRPTLVNEALHRLDDVLVDAAAEQGHLRDVVDLRLADGEAGVVEGGQLGVEALDGLEVAAAGLDCGNRPTTTIATGLVHFGGRFSTFDGCRFQ